MDFWAQSAKHNHFHTLQSDRLNNPDNDLTMDGNDDVRAWFPCPFCYVEIEIPMLSCHLQEEHCFDLKNAVCPICAANLGKEATAHFTTHHVNLIKRRTFPKSRLRSNGANHMREMADRGNAHETTHDPLSAFLRSVPFSELQEKQVSSATSYIKSTNEAEKAKEDHEEKQHQATFVQQLIFSTIF